VASRHRLNQISFLKFLILLEVNSLKFLLICFKVFWRLLCWAHCLSSLIKFCPKRLSCWSLSSPTGVSKETAFCANFLMWDFITSKPFQLQFPLAKGLCQFLPKDFSLFLIYFEIVSIMCTRNSYCPCLVGQSSCNRRLIHQVA